MGDFNYKDIKWENWSTPGCNESSDEFLFVEAFLSPTYSATNKGETWTGTISFRPSADK